MDLPPEEHNNETELSGEQILERCAQTYLAISEYVGQCVVNSHSTSSRDGGPPTSSSRTAQAHFDFKRGIHFNIWGRMTNDTPFAIESSPTKTILKVQRAGQENVRECENLSRAVAAMTGVAARAPTTIPALLTNANWGFPFRSGLVSYLKGHETIEGHDCFVVVQESDAPVKVRTYWIDSQSFLLRQMHSQTGEETEEQVNARRIRLRACTQERGLPDANHKFISRDSVDLFSIDKVVFGDTESIGQMK